MGAASIGRKIRARRVLKSHPSRYTNLVKWRKRDYEYLSCPKKSTFNFIFASIVRKICGLHSNILYLDSAEGGTTSTLTSLGFSPEKLVAPNVDERACTVLEKEQDIISPNSSIEDYLIKDENVPMFNATYYDGMTNIDGSHTSGFPLVAFDQFLIRINREETKKKNFVFAATIVPHNNKGNISKYGTTLSQTAVITQQFEATAHLNNFTVESLEFHSYRRESGKNMLFGLWVVSKGEPEKKTKFFRRRNYRIGFPTTYFNL